MTHGDKCFQLQGGIYAVAYFCIFSHILAYFRIFLHFFSHIFGFCQKIAYSEKFCAPKMMMFFLFHMCHILYVATYFLYFFLYFHSILHIFGSFFFFGLCIISFFLCKIDVLFSGTQSRNFSKSFSL